VNLETLDVTAWRAAERARLLAARTALPLSERRAQDQRITELLLHGFPALSHLTVGFYWPMKGEFDARAAIAHWRENGARAALPVVEKKAHPLAFREWWPEVATVPGVFNLPVPQSDTVAPDAALIPPVGFDARGYRLGYGGGYFDRTLAALTPQPLKIAVAREVCRMPTIHPQPYDIPMDFVVTEAGIHEVAADGLRLVTRVADVPALVERLLEARRRLSQREVADLLNTLLEAERAGARVLSDFMEEMPLPDAAIEELRRLQRDESRNCVALLELLRSLHLPPSTRTGDFLHKVRAAGGTPRARLELLNRGQAWVARKIAGALPRIVDEPARRVLRAMHDSHVANVAACESLIAGLPARAG
jgi:5,10-methenyltetrahydrofolate synthetase